MSGSQPLRTMRLCLILVVIGLFLSGVTAFPLEHETRWLATFVNANPSLPAGLALWLSRVHDALYRNSIESPFLAYGTDWLAFAHIVLAVLFVGPIMDPVRNKWVIQFGVIACAGVLPLALIAGPLRGIPLFWRVIDCSFGVVGVIPLLICLRLLKRLDPRV